MRSILLPSVARMTTRSLSGILRVEKLWLEIQLAWILLTRFVSSTTPHKSASPSTTMVLEPGTVTLFKRKLNITKFWCNKSRESSLAASLIQPTLLHILEPKLEISSKFLLREIYSKELVQTKDFSLKVSTALDSSPTEIFFSDLEMELLLKLVPEISSLERKLKLWELLPLSLWLLTPLTSSVELPKLPFTGATPMISAQNWETLAITKELMTFASQAVTPSSSLPALWTTSEFGIPKLDKNS